jgi:gas vesicle protein
MDLSLLTNLAASAAGALAGAFAAFLLEERRRKKENSETQRSKLLHAQFLLAQKVNSITNLKNALDKISQETNSAEVSKMTHITIDERLSARDLEPLIDGQWVGQAADILRFDRTYADAAEWLSRFNQQKDRIASHPNTKIFEFDLEKGKIGAAVDVPLLMELNSALKNLRESVDQAYQSLPQALDSLLAFMKQKYPGRRTISVSPKKVTR